MGGSLTTSRNQYTSSHDMHTSHSSDQLSASQDHTTTSEDVIDEIEQDEYPVSVFAISHPYELERSMCVRNAKLRNDTKEGHEGDLEREAGSPPDWQCNTPLVCICRTNDTLVDPHPAFDQYQLV